MSLTKPCKKAWRSTNSRKAASEPWSAYSVSNRLGANAYVVKPAYPQLLELVRRLKRYWIGRPASRLLGLVINNGSSSALKSPRFMPLKKSNSVSRSKSYRQIEIPDPKVIQRQTNHVIAPQSSGIGHLQRAFSGQGAVSLAPPAFVESNFTSTPAVRASYMRGNQNAHASASKCFLR
jgi:hypothetical protein